MTNAMKREIVRLGMDGLSQEVIDYRFIQITSRSDFDTLDMIARLLILE